MRKTATLILSSIKEPDAFNKLIDDLGLTEAKRKRYFEFCEYADLELEVDEDLNVVSGRFVERT